MSGPMEQNPTPPHDPKVMSFLAVRRALGLLGLFLPGALFAFGQLSGRGLEPSISDFYHTPMGDVLVGSLVAIGIFLITYRGYPRQPGEALSDRVVSTIAGTGSIGVALFPVKPMDATCPLPDAATGLQGITFHWCAAPFLHFGSAAVFFICLAIFCFCLFPKGNRTTEGRIDWHCAENRVYFVCGVGILIPILSLLVYAVVGDETGARLRSVNFVYWMETVGVVSFAISWLAKGKILRAMPGF